MSESQWTSLDPQPRDFDADLATIDPRFLDASPGDSEGKLRILVSIEGEDAERLERVSTARGERPAELISELLREADGKAA